MSIEACAAAAVSGFPNRQVRTPVGSLPLGLFMLSIGGPESHWDTQAQGDSVSELSAYQVAHPGIKVYFPPSWATCGGFSAWGWLQINWSHYGYLKARSGGSTACTWAQWLYNPGHTVAAAMQLIGLRSSYDYAQIVGTAGPWSGDGPVWQHYLPQAQTAWNAALTQAQQSVPPPSTLPPVAPSPAAAPSPVPLIVEAGAGTLLAAGVVAAGVAALERRRGR